MSRLKKYLLIGTLIAGGIAGSIGGYFIYRDAKETQAQTEITSVKITSADTKLNLETIVNTLKIASFNVQIFGESKSRNEEVMDVLSKTVSNFDIIALQELRDTNNRVLPRFIQRVSQISGKDYDGISSIPLGQSLEKYAFIYNKKKTKLLGIPYVYRGMEFERPPFVACFKSGKFDFILVNVHTKPTDATREIGALVRVIDDADLKFKTEKDVIILGDFNADGEYFSESIKTGLRAREYLWIVKDDLDTTLGKNNYTYDRIVVREKYTGEDYAGRVNVFMFDRIFNIPLEKAKLISDHYPVEAEFYTDRDTDFFEENLN